jgi:hypothetical protein
MSIIVIGGETQGAGKTALICGLIRALPEIPWTAIKVTNHAHGKPTPIWEETAPGQASDTARYLAAGAKRALLLTADDTALGPNVQSVLQSCAPSAGVIFESNRVLRCLQPDLCLAAALGPKGERNASFDLVEQRMDALVELAAHDHAIEGERLCFHLRSLERISAPMLAWLRERLEKTAG